MKKIMLGSMLVSMLFVSVGKAADMITGTLIEHVGTVTQFQSGMTKLALTDSVVLIGNYKGKSILDLQVGFNQNVDGTRGDKLFGAIFLKASTLLQDSVKFPEHWKFLNSIEHGPILIYSLQDKIWRGGYQVGLAFGLNPK